MSVVINSNRAATVASNNLAKSNQMLQRSLNRLSSGMKIVQPSDDAGGLAVSMKLSATINRTNAVSTNIANAQSFLQTQDGAFQVAGKVMDRISELKILASDVTKNSSDIANYDTEFSALQEQLTAISGETFNGVSLFTSGASATTQDGATTVDIDQASLGNDLTSITGASDLATLAISDITGSIKAVAILRAENGAQSNRLSFASNLL